MSIIMFTHSKAFMFCIVGINYLSYIKKCGGLNGHTQSNWIKYVFNGYEVRHKIHSPIFHVCSIIHNWVHLMVQFYVEVFHVPSDIT